MSGTIIEGVNNAIQTKFSLDKLLYYFCVNVESHVVKKNRRPIYTNKATGKTFIGKSKELSSAEQFLELQLKSQANKQGLKEPINEPIWAILHFYFPRDIFFTQKNEISKKLPDLSNLLELPMDSLQKAGVLENDTLVHSFDLSRRLYADEFRLEIFLLKHGFAN